jgi:cell division protein FtsB
LFKKEKLAEELKKLLSLEKGKVEKLDQELAQSKETTCSLKSSIGALQGQYDILIKTHQDLETQFDALWSSSSKTSSDPKAPQAPTSKGYERCYNIDINASCSNVEQILVEICDDAIRKENDNLKREVKKLELEVNKLKKQAKVQPPQDNRSNMVKKLEKEKTTSKIASQQPKKQDQNKNDEKVEYAMSVFLNARRSHMKSGIGNKNGDKHNSRVKIKGQEFIKFTKVNVQPEKKQSINTTNKVSYSYTNASHVSHISYHDFDASYVLMRNKIGKIIILHIGPHHKRLKTCVWVPNCLVTKLKGPNQTWVPKTKG